MPKDCVEDHPILVRVYSGTKAYRLSETRDAVLSRAILTTSCLSPSTTLTFPNTALPFPTLRSAEDATVC
jgi:hypothetical protein